MKIVTLIEYPNGGKVDTYAIADITAKDFKNVFACCDYFARQGANTVIMPRFFDTVGNPMYEKIYASLKGTQYWGKCPDFTVNGLWYEHEGYDVNKDLSDLHKRADTFSLMMKRGVKQSDRIVVEDCGVTRRFARHNIYSRTFYELQNITEVFIKKQNSLEIIYKKETD